MRHFVSSVAVLLLCIAAMPACAARGDVPSVNSHSIPVCDDSTIGVTVTGVMNDESISHYHSQLVALRWIPNAESYSVVPVTDPPRLQNAREVQRTLRSVYPRSLRNQGIGGTATHWYLLDADGNVTHVQLKEGTGHQELNEAAARALASFRFSAPVTNDCRLQHYFSSTRVTFDASN
jgi:TonB family protein